MTTKIHDYGYRTPRYQADFRLLLQCAPPSTVLIDARCTALSEDGLAAEVNMPLEVGTRVMLILMLPGKTRSIKIGARVTNRQLEVYGFAFIFSSLHEQKYMRDYIESQRSTMVRSPE